MQFSNYVEDSSLFRLQVAQILNATVEHFVLQNATEKTSVSAGVVPSWKTFPIRSETGHLRTVLFLHVKRSLPVVASPRRDQPVTNRVPCGGNTRLDWLRLEHTDQLWKGNLQSVKTVIDLLPKLELPHPLLAPWFASDACHNWDLAFTATTL